VELLDKRGRAHENAIQKDLLNREPRWGGWPAPCSLLGAFVVRSITGRSCALRSALCMSTAGCRMRMRTQHSARALAPPDMHNAQQLPPWRPWLLADRHTGLISEAGLLSAICGHWQCVAAANGQLDRMSDVRHVARGTWHVVPGPPSAMPVRVGWVVLGRVGVEGERGGGG
jgi:hypothetical protein